MKKTFLISLLFLSVLCGTYGQGRVIISEIMYDTPLNEQIAAGGPYSNGEYVELYNESGKTADLTGWTLRGGGVTEIYPFPAGTQMPPFSFLIVAYQCNNSNFTLDRLYTGIPSHTPVLYQRKIILSNTGEAVYLKDAVNVTRDSIYYDGSSNKRKADRLSADNEDDAAPGNQCVSVQRIGCTSDSEGNVIPRNADWITAVVTIGQMNTAYVPPAPDVILTTPEIPSASGGNYIRSRTMLDESGTRYLDDIQYFDGLGRPVQLVQRMAGGGKEDLVTTQTYDAFGRESKTYLPVPAAGNNGGYLPLFPQVSYYGDDNPYAETGYEPSPLNRVTSQYGPGSAWRAGGGHPVKTEYLTNTASGDLSCAYYYVTTDGKLAKNGNYSPDQLYVTKTTDEDGNDTYEFKDKLGRVVLSRMADKTQSGNNRLHDTYYVYDDFGNRRFVLPPLASDALTANKTWGTDDYTLGLYAYLYKYDDRLRCTEKKLPGVEPVYFVYDRADRLILTQDGNQREKSEWSFNKYDAFGRVILSGILTDTRSFEILKGYYRYAVVTESPQSGGDYGYSRNTAPNVTPDKVLTVNYYDDYELLLNQDPGFRQKLSYETKAGYGEKYVNAQCPSCPAKGQLVGTRVKMLDGGGREIVTAMYYDKKGRPVQTKSVNHLGGVDKEYVSYDFVGNPTGRLLVHGTGNITEQYRYEYDHAGRPAKTWHKIDNQAEVLMSEQAYDALGRLSSKKLHNGTETVNYAYNIRDGLTGINSPRFMESLHYQDAPSGTTARYNGNISAMTWKVDREPFVRGYNFVYDGLNRLKEADYTEGGAGSSDGGLFGESFRYDKHGNITTLYRNSVPVSGVRNQGAEFINTMNYIYSGNRLQSIYDSGSGGSILYGSQAFTDSKTYRPGEYLYDKNGNMTTDYNKGIAKINYNVLNLPEAMQFKQGHGINYGYDASGTKRVVDAYTAIEGVTVQMGTTETVSVLYHSGLDYCGNAVYFGSGTGVSRLYTPEGYINRQYGVTGNWIYYYTLKDHLGSVRYEFKGDGTNVGYTHYYPSGIEFTDPGTNSQTLQSKERYNDKELQTDFGLNWYDVVARGYDPAVVRPWQIDPLAEKRPWESPYLWCGGNPMNAIDPDGRDYYVMTGDGRMVLALKTDDNYDRLFAVQGERQNNVVYKIENVTGSLRVNDQGILSALSENPDAKIHYTLTDSRSDALNVFKFAADNTNVEWDVHKFTENNTIKYSIGTNHEKNSSPGAEKMGHSEASVIASIHSHPGAEPDRRSELNSMGVDIDPWDKNKVSIPDVAKIVDNDYILKTNSEYSNSLYYIYMQRSRNVWQIKKDGSIIPWGNTSITSLIK